MSRITGTDAANLIEAYNSLYAPQEEVELTEEQVQEDFENWVNSLVEEGHDLSEYTWEDMYEHYLNEAPIRYSTGPTAADLQRQRAQASTRPAPAQNLRGLSIGPGGFRINNRPVQPGMSPIFQRPGQPAPVRPARPAATTPTRPATPSAPVSQRPAAAPAAAAKPATTATAPVATTPAAPARTFNPLMQRTFGYQTGNAPDQIAKASAGAPPAPAGGALGAAARPEVRAALNLPARPAAATPTPAPAATPTAPKPPVKKTLTPTQMRQGISASFDPFDVVMGYLIDEGYAENEEAATVIMANMSEEWRDDILKNINL